MARAKAEGRTRTELLARAKVVCNKWRLRVVAGPEAPLVRVVSQAEASKAAKAVPVGNPAVNRVVNKVPASPVAKVAQAPGKPVRAAVGPEANPAAAAEAAAAILCN